MSPAVEAYVKAAPLRTPFLNIRAWLNRSLLELLVFVLLVLVLVLAFTLLLPVSRILERLFLFRRQQRGKFPVVLFAQFLLSGLLFFGLERAVVSHRDQLVDKFANDRSDLGLLVWGYLGNSLQTL
jgi:hypothetical protein